MPRLILALIIVCFYLPSFGQITERVGHLVSKNEMPSKENLHIYIMAGQSNMAGRGTVEPSDSIINKRVFSINKYGDWVYAQEPLHFHEPNLVGLDCGKSFGDYMADMVPPQVTIAVIPTAVGGSSLSQWLEDHNHRGVNLLSNFKEKVNMLSQYGTIKGIIWHQGESDSNEEDVLVYFEKMQYLKTVLRRIVGSDRSLPFVMGELAAFWANTKNPIAHEINKEMKELAGQDRFAGLISTSDLTSKGDSLHFGSEAQRIMGKRYANEILKLTYSDDEKAIRVNNQKFSLHVMNGNYDEVIKTYSNTAVIFPSRMKILDKREEIAGYWTPSPSNTNKNIYHRIIPTKIKVMGDFAYDWGRYEGATLQGDGTTVAWQGKYVVHWKKNAKGEWKIDLDIWNRTDD